MNAEPVLVHEDAAFVVLEKPAGLLAVPGRGEHKQDCLWHRARRRWPELLVVHRLDEATSGLMLFARNAEAQRRLSAAFEQRRVHKRYEAVVYGLMAGEQGSVDLPLAADWPNRPRQRVDHQQGKPSLTEWQVLQRDPAARLTRVALVPRTGRSHQLRVHLHALGHPIVGDRLYAPAVASPPGADLPSPPPPPRLLLHATQLAFEHPVSALAVCAESKAPF